MKFKVFYYNAETQASHSVIIEGSRGENIEEKFKRAYPKCAVNKIKVVRTKEPANV